MGAIVAAALVVAAGFCALLCIIFGAEILASLFEPVRNVVAPPMRERGKVAVLIPAHNEGIRLKPTLDDVISQLYPQDRVVVIADNCDDDTASVARGLGGEVVERSDSTRRGKGFALEYGINHLAGDPPDIVIIIDADCRVAPGAIDILAGACGAAGRPVQALDLMVAPADRKIDHRLAEFAWRVKNWARPLGMRALGLPCQLMGTGMAFPWRTIRSAGFGGGHLAEDLKLGLELARVGHAAQFCPSAMVTSEFPSTSSAARDQRQRWESGHLTTIVKDAAPLILQALRTRNRDLLVLALDLAVPPLTLLLAINLTLVVLSAVGFMLGLSPVPLYISAASLALLAICIGVCWFRFGRDILTGAVIRAGGTFIVTKLRVYLNLLVRGRPMQWDRTERDHSRNDGNP